MDMASSGYSEAFKFGGQTLSVTEGKRQIVRRLGHRHRDGVRAVRIATSSFLELLLITLQ